MSSTNTTYAAIIQAHNLISQQENDLYYKLMVGESKIRNAKATLSIYVLSISDKLKKLQNEYFVIENGDVVILPPQEGDTQPKFKMLEGKTFEDYQKAEDEYLKQEINIKING